MKNDLISRKAALDQWSKLVEYDEGGWGINVRAVKIEDLYALPAVDAVEVVRCKDCAEYIPWLYGERVCGRVGSEFGRTKPDDYCSRGRKR